MRRAGVSSYLRDGGDENGPLAFLCLCVFATALVRCRSRGGDDAMAFCPVQADTRLSALVLAYTEGRLSRSCHGGDEDVGNAGRSADYVMAQVEPWTPCFPIGVIFLLLSFSFFSFLFTHTHTFTLSLAHRAFGKRKTGDCRLFELEVIVRIIDGHAAGYTAQGWLAHRPLEPRTWLHTHCGAGGCPPCYWSGIHASLCPSDGCAEKLERDR